MSMEAVGYVQKCSPYKGMTFIVHLAVADIASTQDDYRIWVSHQMITKYWPISIRSVDRGIAELIEGGYLTVLDDSQSQNKRIYYQFEFKNADQPLRGDQAWA